MCAVSKQQVTRNLKGTGELEDIPPPLSKGAAARQENPLNGVFTVHDIVFFGNCEQEDSHTWL